MDMTNGKRTIEVLSIGSDDKELSLQSLFSNFPDVVLSAQVADSEALTALRERSVDVALIDLGFSDSDAIELTRQIRQDNPSVRIIIITASDTPDDIFSVMDAGADGYVLKGSVSEVLETAICSVRLGAVYLDPGIAQQVLKVMEIKASVPSRTLPTGVIKIPLLPDEKSILVEVASSSCKDGVCMVDPAFVRKLRRFSSAD